MALLGVKKLNVVAVPIVCEIDITHAVPDPDTIVVPPVIPVPEINWPAVKFCDDPNVKLVPAIVQLTTPDIVAV